jgi:hypothetical protein
MSSQPLANIVPASLAIGLSEPQAIAQGWFPENLWQPRPGQRVQVVRKDIKSWTGSFGRSAHNSVTLKAPDGDKTVALDCIGLGGNAMRLRFALVAGLMAICGCAQPSFPAYPYYLPAIAEGGGPVYVIPGTVTQNSTIGFSVSGQACEQSPGIDCFNAAGVITVKGSTQDSNVGEAGKIDGKFGGFSGSYNLGSLLMSIEGVGTVQVFPATQANGLGSKNPPTSFTLSPTTFVTLGFPPFTQENARIRFFVVDDYYPDNSGGFLLNLQSPTITFDAVNYSSKVKQMVGPCDWQVWWNTNQSTCAPTAASGSNSEVLGNDLGGSFLSTSKEGDLVKEELIFLFGDTFGVQLPFLHPIVQTSPTSDPNTYVAFNAADPIATALPPGNAASLTLSFSPASPLPPQFVTPADQPGNPPVPVVMTGDDVPNSGIQVQGTNYIVVNTGANTCQTNFGAHVCAYSVLVQDAGNKTFTSGRTISVANEPNAIDLNPPIQTGHFVFVALAHLPLAYAEQIGQTEPGVLLVGNGEYRAESIYLSYVPESEFWTGLDSDNKRATRYFAGLDKNGLPTWTDVEMKAMPILYDNPYGLPQGPGVGDPGTVGNASIAYNSELALWLMTWDGGRVAGGGAGSATGVYFSTASAPWGPWSTPQLIYNACVAHQYGQGYGDFIRYVKGADDICAGTVKEKTGPAGPISGTKGEQPFIGSNSGETALTLRGAVYAPFMIPGLTMLTGNSLTVGYNMSTWNPYTSVLMQSNFNVAPPIW